MFLHVFFLFPETAGKSLEQVSAIFEDPNGIKYLGTPAWRTHRSKGGAGGEKGRDPEEARLTFHKDSTESGSPDREGMDGREKGGAVYREDVGRLSE